MSTPSVQRAGDADPFNLTPTSTNREKTKSLRHSQIDSTTPASFSRGSPSQAKRALEAHIADTDRRIQDATKLGTTLLDQKKQLSERLSDLDAQQGDDEIGTDLKQKLSELEKEYNEIGRDTTRTFISRGSRSSIDIKASDNDRTPLADKGSNANTDRKLRPESPEKMGKGSMRKSKNQTQNRVHDIEFATEISTSLLGQVRGLQNLLAEKEDALKKTQKENSRLQTDFETLAQRMRGLGDEEQNYKDENWNLETQVQDLTAVIKEAALREEKLQQTLSSAKQDKATSEREYEELRSQHGKLTDEHAALQKTHDLHLADLKRNLEDGQTERDEMQRRIDELYSQNQDLARAVAYRANIEQDGEGRDINPDDVVESIETGTPEASPPASPVKATPRHGALESETLKSSLHHAHRMIQTLKNNIHREKTEKIELKRMLQDARDEMEQQRIGSGSGAAANAGRKRKPATAQDGFKKPGQPSKLGGVRNTSEWEDYEGGPSRKVSAVREADFSTDASDAFETADERHTDAQTDTDAAFESAADTMAGSTDDDDLTETEDNFKTSMPSSLSRSPMLKRGSFQSTASDEEDAFDPDSPSLRQPKYRLRLNRGVSRRSETPMRDSPASFVSNASNQSLPQSSQNLATELEGMDSPSSTATSRATTVEASSGLSPVASQTPDVQRRATSIWSSVPPLPPKPVYIDSGMITEPWESEQERVETAEAAVGPTERVVGVDAVAAALRSSADAETKEAATQSTPKKERSPMTLQISNISSQSTVPIAPPEPKLEDTVTVASTPRISEVDRTVTPSTLISATTSNAGEDFEPPSIPSVGKGNKLAPSTQKFLDDILAQARERRAETLRAKAVNSATSTSESSKATEQDVTMRQGVERSPSFTISIPDRDVGQVLTSEAKTPEGRSVDEPPLRVHTPEDKDDGVFEEPTLSLDDPYSVGLRTPVQYDLSLSPSVRRTDSREMRSASRTMSPGMINSSTQTIMSGERIDSLLKDGRHRSLTNSASSATRGSPVSGRAMSMGTSTDPNLAKTLGKRPSSSGSASRVTTGSPAPGEEVPPLPADHKEVIAEAKTRTSSLMSIPPPNFPASKVTPPAQARDRSSNSIVSQSPMRVMNSARNRTSSIAGRSETSRRSSISSFASEIEERFNIDRNSGMAAYSDFPGQNNADPRMIQAITQTMIGEFLWKYTRKTGRGDSHSENRHRRFFWIHPYTRTLYWSNQDPSVAGRSELKAKSVAIEAVRVLGDNNPIPPGLCNKSVVIVTPGRSIKFTAPTQKRHETWFNALSYLLLRSAPDQDGDVGSHVNNASNTTSSGITAEDVAEFNPGNFSRTTSRFSHRSLSSVGTSGRRSVVPNNSYRTSSPQGRSPAGGVSNSLAVRQSQAALKRETSTSGNGGKESPNGHSVQVNSESGVAESPNGISDVARSKGNGAFSSPAKDGKVDTAAQVGESQLEVDAEGFKKPALPPLSTTTSKSNRPPTKPDASKDGTEGHAPESSKSGPFGGLASRISRSSFASIRRGRRATKSEAEMAPPASPAASDGHEHQYVFKRKEDGTLENVRACCNGKHDLSTLRHRSASRTSLGRRRSQSTNGKRMSFSQRVAPRPAGGS